LNRSGRKRAITTSESNALSRFVEREIWHPEKRAGNAMIVLSISVFGAAIAFLRNFGDLLAV
jgi:hypothetical protein